MYAKICCMLDLGWSQLYIYIKKDENRGKQWIYQLLFIGDTSGDPSIIQLKKWAAETQARYSTGMIMPCSIIKMTVSLLQIDH